MKIGILTFHRAINYGAVLQCFALSEYLKSLGHSVQVIDYRPGYLEKSRTVFQLKKIFSANILKTIKHLAWYLINWRANKRLIVSFDNFINQNLALSPVVTSPQDVPQDFDAIFFGSDQIWNPSICHGVDQVFWGQLSKGHTRFITYAASIGRTALATGSNLLLMREYIKNYDAISVREDVLRQFVMETFERKDVTLVVDPSQLLKSHAYDSMAVKPREEDYVLLFTLEDNPQARQIAQTVSSQLGNLPVVKFSSYLPLRREQNVKYVAGCSPEQFLGYFKHARCIVCISFHAVSFSILFKKDFYCVKTPMFERAYNLLSLCGLQSRMIQSAENLSFTPIDYSLIGSGLEQQIASSKEFISEALGEIN